MYIHVNVLCLFKCFPVIIFMLAQNKILPSAVPTTSACMSISHFGQAKPEMDTVVCFRLCRDIGLE